VAFDEVGEFVSESEPDLIESIDELLVHVCISLG